MSPRKPAPLVGPLGRTLLGCFLIASGLVLVVLLVQLWPTVERGTGEAAARGGNQELSLFWGAIETSVTPDSALILLVIVAAALGSYVHAATSFGDYVGNQRLGRSWVWWYLLRVFIGASLALLFYFAVRGGFLAADASSGDVNPFGIAALAGLVGLFSKQATDKLRELFDTLFRVDEGRGDAERRDSISNPVPYVAGIEPPGLQAGGETTTVRLLGEGFVEGCTVRVSRIGAGGEMVMQRTLDFVSPTELDLTLLTDDLREAGYFDIVVVNPEPGGGASQAVRLDVSPVLVPSSNGAAGDAEPEAVEVGTP